jgi:hypothetical protein
VTTDSQPKAFREQSVMHKRVSSRVGSARRAAKLERDGFTASERGRAQDIADRQFQMRHAPAWLQRQERAVVMQRQDIDAIR